jgi:hypothetical protein
MSKKQSLEQALCASFCSYYKPGSKEDLACKGYTVLERLLQVKKTNIPDQCASVFDSRTADMLVQKMCATCDFHENDCDYMQNRTSSPCGGFILLAQLFMSKEIVAEDIE